VHRLALYSKIPAFGLAAPAFIATFAARTGSRSTTDSIGASEALDLGSIPNETTKKALTLS
jgi:hypothetical protein